MQNERRWDGDDIFFADKYVNTCGYELYIVLKSIENKIQYMY